MKRKKIGVVLSGAVAKGAFEAGALLALAERPVEIRRIVATSSGALNGVALAAAVHGASSETSLVEAMKALCEFWTELGSYRNALRLRPSWRGLADQGHLRRLLVEHVVPRPRGVAGNDVSLSIVVAALAGLLPEGSATSTFEQEVALTDSAFVSNEGLGAVFEAAEASASFPGVFAPSDVTGLGACVDGGAVNNAAIGKALDDDAEIEAVVVISPTPADARIGVDEAAALKGTALAGRVADMLVNERLHRDLEEARWTNRALLALEGLENRDEVLRRLELHRRRVVEVICVRPEGELRGNAFSAMFDRGLREEYVRAGLVRGRAELATL